MTDKSNELLKKRKEKISAVKKELKSGAERLKQSVPANTVTSNRLELLITVVDRKKADYYVDLIQSFDVNMQMSVLARGTANANMLDLLGLSDSSKTVILSVIQEEKLSDALAALDEKFKTIKDGKGVACTVPVSSVIGTLIYTFLSDNRQAVKGGKQNG